MSANVHTETTYLLYYLKANKQKLEKVFSKLVSIWREKFQITKRSAGGDCFNVNEPIFGISESGEEGQSESQSL